MALDRGKVLEAAQKQLAKGQYDKAIAEYWKLVQEDPEDVRAWLKIGDLYTRKGARRDACDTYAKVARQYADRGFYLKAVAVYKQILKLDPNQLEAYVKLAEMYEQLELYNDALSTYEQIANMFAEQGRAEAYLDTLKHMTRLDPDNVPIRIKHAEALSKAGRTDEAAEEFDAGARRLREQGRHDDYLKVAERLFYHRPNDERLARELAEMYLARNDAKRALPKLQVCFKADPRNVDTLDLLARAFQLLEQTAKALSVYRELARLHGEQGNEKEHARVLRRVLELAPDDQDAQQALARYEAGAQQGSAGEAAAADPGPQQSPAQPASANASQVGSQPSGGSQPLSPQALGSAAQGPAAGAEPPAETGETTDENEEILEADDAELVEPDEVEAVEEEEDETAFVRSLEAPADDTTETSAAPEGTSNAAEASGAGLAPAHTAEQPAEVADDEEDILIVEEDDEQASVEEPSTGVEGEPQTPAAARGEVSESQIRRLLTDCDVFVRYGLQQKVVEQLEQVLALDPHHIEARERLKDTHLEMGNTAGAIEQLHALAAQFAESKPHLQQLYLRQVLELDANDAAAREGLGMAPPAQEPESAAAPTPRPDVAPPGTEVSGTTAAVTKGTAPLEEPNEGGSAAPSSEWSDSTIADPIPLVGGTPEDAGDATGTPDEARADAGAAESEDDVLFVDEEDESAEPLEPAAEEPEPLEPPLAAEPEPLEPPPAAEPEPLEPPPAAEPEPLEPPPAAEPEPLEPQPAAHAVPSPEAEPSALAAATSEQTAVAPEPQAPANVEPTVAAPYPQTPGEDASPLEQPGQGGAETRLAPMAPSQPEAAQPAPERTPQAPGEIEEALDEAEFFMAQGLWSEARSTLEETLGNHPDHPLLLDKLNEVAEGELETAQASAEQPAAEASDDDQSFELAEKLAEELGPEPQDVDATQQIDVETVFAQFKKGVAETVGQDDIDTHYDLGIAYKEMGLYDDAVEEFKLCTGARERECLAHTMIGMCYMEKNDVDEAIAHFKKGLYAEQKDEAEELGLYFELGQAYELLHDPAEALYYFQKVQKRDPNFRNVGDKVQKLQQAQPQQAQRKASPSLDDIDQAFDDLLNED